MCSYAKRLFWFIVGYWIVFRGKLLAARGIRFIGFPVIRNSGTIEIGKFSSIRSSGSSTAMGVITPVVLNAMTPDAMIKIGDQVGISGAVICAKRSIQIGDRVLLGSGVVICDTDFHSLDYNIRGTDQDLIDAAVAPVRVGNDCFIGGRAMILKGVTVGDRSIVGAGSVVVKDVPSDVVVAGNPARIVKRLNGC
ncbi:MAG: acyltransferase [Opitutae bacterium]|nr:acyltransferase [Opitutae bacterium]